MSMKVKYWGCRGSLPSAPTPERWAQDFEQLMLNFFRAGYKDATEIKQYMKSQTLPQIGGFGTATTCAQVVTDKTEIIIDGGSGIHMLSPEAMRGPAGKGKAEIHIVMTHFHWDHILGLPFYAPHFIKGNVINFYAVQPELEEVIRLAFKKPMFPVPFEALGAEIKFHRLAPREPFKIGDVTLTPYQLDHPDPCWGYRMVNDGKVYSHCVDTEGTRISAQAMGADLPLYQGVDLMYFDAQYTLPELAEKANWGHSAAQLGLDIAFRENVKHIVFAHHDPGADTRQVFELKTQTKEYYDWKMKTSSANNIKLPAVKWQYAYEGMVIEVGVD
jgi:phosphoribosyl 1,2-cyclic phosphodiesterase